MRRGRGPRRTQLFVRKINNFSLAPGIFSASIVGCIVFEVLLSVKYIICSFIAMFWFVVNF